MGAIYSLQVPGDDRLYVGSAVRFRQRLNQHLHLLRAGRHHCLKLRRAVAVAGVDNVAAAILETVDNPADLLAREQFWMDHYWPRLFNTNPRAESRLGATMPADAIAAISKSLVGNSRRLGIPHDADTKSRIGAGLRAAYAKGRHKRANQPENLRSFNADVAAGRRDYSFALTRGRVVAILTTLHATNSCVATGAIFDRTPAAIYYVAKLCRDRLDDTVEAATGCRPTGLHRSRIIHPDWFDLAA